MQLRKTAFGLSLSLFFATVAASQTAEKVLAVQQAQLTSLQVNVFAIGSIQQSILTLEQFQKLAGPGWVSMNGQAIPDSKLCKTVGICKVPNASGRFLRSAGAVGSAPEARVGDLQDDQVNKERVSATVDISHSHGAHAHQAYPTWCAVGGVSASGGHPHAMRIADYDRCSPSGTDVGNTLGAEVSLGPTSKGVTIGGGTETRPYNLVVNSFIKIN